MGGGCRPGISIHKTCRSALRLPYRSAYKTSPRACVLYTAVTYGMSERRNPVVTKEETIGGGVHLEVLHFHRAAPPGFYHSRASDGRFFWRGARLAFTMPLRTHISQHSNMHEGSFRETATCAKELVGILVRLLDHLQKAKSILVACPN